MTSMLNACLARRGLLMPALLALITLVLVKLGSPAPPGLCLIGDARHYLNGTIDPSLHAAYFDATGLALGVGRAALDDWNGLGDALLIDGRMYVRSTAVGTPDYYRVRNGQRFLTSTFAYLPAAGRPHVPLAIESPRPLAAWRQALAVQYPGGALVAGYVQFARLSTIAVSRPAIGGIPVTGHAERYYTEPREERFDRWAYVVGVIVRHPLTAAHRHDPMIARLLAPTALDRSANLIHALVLDAPPAGLFAPPAPERVVALGRVTDESEIAAARLAVYPLNRLTVCAPPRPPELSATAP